MFRIKTKDVTIKNVIKRLRDSRRNIVSVRVTPPRTAAHNHSFAETWNALPPRELCRGGPNP